jgi:hypothetical protein
MVKIQAEVPELYSGTLPLGIPAVITFDALPGDTLREECRLSVQQCQRQIEQCK